jgi:hypothetical protein
MDRAKKEDDDNMSREKGLELVPTVDITGTRARPLT